MKFVVCDDDTTLRSVISRMAEAAGHTVIAETDSAETAVELVVRFGAEGLVLDLALPWGSGMGAVRSLRERGQPCQVVIFTAYAGDTPDLRDSMVRAIVEKPDFDSLENVLEELAHGKVATETAGPERRRQPRERPLIPVTGWRTPSGLEVPDAFDAVIDVLEPGDAFLCIRVGERDGVAPDTPWNQLVQRDRFLAVARTLRTILRAQDRLSVERDELVAILIDGGRSGVDSVWRRLERSHEQAGTGGVVSGGWLVVDVEPPRVALGRALAASARSVGQPPGDRLWAG